MAVIHPQSDFISKPHACHMRPCKKCFARRHELLRHYKVHLTGDARAKNLLLPILWCSSNDFQRSNVKSHIKTKHRRHKPLVCLECTNFWVATDLTALAEHDTTVHGAISPPQRQQREHCLTVGSQSISSTVAFLRASDSNPFPHLRDAVVHHRFAVDDTKHNSLASSHSLPTYLPTFKASSGNIQVDRRQFHCFSSHASTPYYLPSLSEVLRELGYRPIDDQPPPASPSAYYQQNLPSPRADPPYGFLQWISTSHSPSMPTSRNYKANFNGDNVVTRYSDSAVWSTPGSSRTEKRVISDYCRAGGLK